MAHLAPGLRDLSVYIDNLGAEASSVIADLPVLEALSLLGGSYTEHGLQQLSRLRKLRHLHIERDGLTPSMFRFAAAMPALTTSHASETSRSDARRGRDEDATRTRSATLRAWPERWETGIGMPVLTWRQVTQEAS